jgi:hypothetical protein
LLAAPVCRKVSVLPVLGASGIEADCRRSGCNILEGRKMNTEIERRSKDWLSSLKKGDLVLYCFQGGAGHIYPYAAVFLRRGKTFIEVQIDRYQVNGEPYPTRLSAEGLKRWRDVGYFATLAPFEELPMRVKETTATRLRHNAKLICYGMKPKFEIPSTITVLGQEICCAIDPEE